MSLRENIIKFIEKVKELENYDDNDSDGYKKEFRKIVSLSKKYLQEKRFPATVGELQYNLGKNRYKDILPYDHSRVVLSEVQKQPGSDYINANFINGATGTPTYIASQGPQPNTVNDFWRMLWQFDVHVVVMACNEYEGVKMKCKRYWPTENEGIEFDGILVNQVEEQAFDEFTVRILQASFEKKTRLLYQLHYTSWPDHGTPANLDQILDMIALARQYQGHNKSPIVVHCSAGCGRTGTILAIDFAWNLLKLGKLDSNFSIFELVKHFRTQRQSIVQSEDQYVFVHMAVKELFERHLQVIDDHFYENMAIIDGVCTQESSDEIYENIDNTGQESDAEEKHHEEENTAVSGNNALKSEKVAGQSQENPPLPPPKPERLIFKESPTKATIEQTLARLFSESDVESESYVNISCNKPIKLDIPRRKRVKDKPVTQKTDELDMQSIGKSDVRQSEKPVKAVKPAVNEMKNARDLNQEPRVKAEGNECRPSPAPKPSNIRKSTKLGEQLHATVSPEEVHIVPGKNIKANHNKVEAEETGRENRKVTCKSYDGGTFEATEYNVSDVSTFDDLKFAADVESSSAVNPAPASTGYSNAESHVQPTFLEENVLYDDKKPSDSVLGTQFESKEESNKGTDGSDRDSVFDSDDEANAPEIPKKNFYLTVVQEKTSVAVTFKGSDISFGHRVEKPKGPRGQQSFRNIWSGMSA